jgi:cation transport ATPase
MSWIAEVFSSSVGTVVKEVGSAIDSLVTSDEERLQLKNALMKIEVEASNKKDEINLQYDKEVSERHKADMNSDSWLSKNIRPMTLIFILVMYSLLSISSGFDFQVTESYVELLGQWGMLIMSFYFGGRTVEKAIKHFKGK